MGHKSKHGNGKGRGKEKSGKPASWVEGPWRENEYWEDAELAEQKKHPQELPKEKTSMQKAEETFTPSWIVTPTAKYAGNENWPGRFVTNELILESMGPGEENQKLRHAIKHHCTRTKPSQFDNVNVNATGEELRRQLQNARQQCLL